MKHVILAIALLSFVVGCGFQTSSDTSAPAAAPTPVVTPEPEKPTPHTPGTQLVTVTPTATPTRIHTMPPTTFTATPSASGSPQITPTPLPATPTPVPVATMQHPKTLADCPSMYGSGRITYCQVDIAFHQKYGDDIPGKVWYYRDPAQYAQILHFLKIETDGVPAAIRKFGCDKAGWSPRRSLPIIGQFTGSQHEWVGNEYIAIAAQLAGYDDKQFTSWLLWGTYDRNVKQYGPAFTFCK